MQSLLMRFFIFLCPFLTIIFTTSSHVQLGQLGQLQDNGNQNLFTEYLSRGMFSCGTNYVASLRKLNKLILETHKEYSECKKVLANVHSGDEESITKLALELGMFGERLH
uniref:Uncharacterized protein n=1 Tax=Globodera pallida TaxID=36090 RepID=A0A183C9Y6_GLOPA